MTTPAPDPGRDSAAGPGRLAVVVNGEARVLVPGTTVAEVVAGCFAGTGGIAVARNREVVAKSAWASTLLDAGDRIEIVTAAAGG